MRFSNRSAAIQSGYSMMETDNRTPAMSVLATAVVVDVNGASFRVEFPPTRGAAGIQAVLDTGGGNTALKAPNDFIKAVGWVACKHAQQGATEEEKACNRNCPTDQGADARFWNTSFRVELVSNVSFSSEPHGSTGAGDEQERGQGGSSSSSSSSRGGGGGGSSRFTIVASPLSAVWSNSDGGSPNLWVGKSLPDVFSDFGTQAINTGGPTFEAATMLIDTQRPRLGLKAH
jgi:hypothetical protein